MKLNRIPLIAALFLIVGTSCNNTIKILAPYKDITVVYGLLDQNDPIHYIRINKAYEGAGNAYTMAQVYDSIYYPVNNITAVLEDSSTTSYTIVKKYTLDTTTSIPMPPGIFSYPKQLLYYTTATLNPNDYYTVIITNTKTGKTLRGTTGLLSDLDFTTPNFSNSKTFDLSFYAQYPTNIEWTTSANTRIYQLDVRFYYTEVGNTTSTLDSLDWLFASLTSPTLTGGVQLSYNLSGQGLLDLIGSSIKTNPYVVRYIDSLGFIFTSGSDDLNTYVQLSQPPTGLNQDVPSFSDVENGIGLFTSRHVQVSNKTLANSDLIDSLTTESKYIPLNFRQ